MLRHSVTTWVALLLMAGAAQAVDKEVKGKLVKIDADAKTLTLQTDDGKKDFSVGADTKFFGPQDAASKDGLKDKRLVAGAEIRLVLPATGRGVKEVHFAPAAAATTKDTKDAKAPAKDAKVAAKDAKAAPSKDTKAPAKDAGNAPAKEAPGDEVEVVKVDVDKRVVTVTTEAGKKMDYTLGEDVKFVGPRGGHSDKGIKDDRFVAGAKVKLVMNGKTVTEVHLPYRSTLDKDEKKDK